MPHTRTLSESTIPHDYNTLPRQLNDTTEETHHQDPEPPNALAPFAATFCCWLILAAITVPAAITISRKNANEEYGAPGALWGSTPTKLHNQIVLRNVLRTTSNLLLTFGIGNLVFVAPWMLILPWIMALKKCDLIWFIPASTISQLAATIMTTFGAELHKIGKCKVPGYEYCFSDSEFEACKSQVLHDATKNTLEIALPIAFMSLLLNGIGIYINSCRGTQQSAEASPLILEEAPSNYSRSGSNLFEEEAPKTARCECPNITTADGPYSITIATPRGR